MEDICKSIEASYQTTLVEQQQQRKHSSATTTAAATGANRTTPIAPPAGDAHHAVRTLNVATLIECEDALRACRVLTKQNSFGAAAKVFGEFHRLVEEFCEGSNDEVHQNVTLRRRLVALQVSGSFLNHEIREKMILRLTDNSAASSGKEASAAGSFADGARVLADMHAGIEVMEKCSPATALSRLLVLHDDVFDRMQEATKCEDDAVGTAQRVQQLVVSLAWYLAQVESHRLQELDGLYSIVAPAASLSDIAQIDPKSASVEKGSYLSTLRLQLCGHTIGAKRRFSKHTGSTIAEGWALSPTGTTPPIQVYIVAPAASLSDIAQIDPKSASVEKGSYLSTLRLQLCGHTIGAKRRFSKHTGSTIAEGWALSPAGTTPPIQVSRSEYRRVETHALDVIHRILATFVASSSALLRVESLLLAPTIKSTVWNGSAMPEGLWNVGAWSDAVKRSINTAVEGAVGAALQRAQQGLKLALQSQTATAAPVRTHSFKRSAPSSSSSSREEAVIATILQLNGYRTSPSSAPTSEQHHNTDEHREDVFSSSLKQLNSILDAAGNRQVSTTTTTNHQEPSSPKAMFSPTVVQLLLHGIEAMCEILESAPHAEVSSSSSSKANERDDGVFRSGLCSVVAKVLTDLKVNVRHDAAAGQTIATLEARITAMYSECQQQWLHEVTDRFTTAVTAAYARTILQPSFFTQCVASNDHDASSAVLSSRFVSARVRSALANVWHTHAVEGTTEVSFPVYFTPGVSRAVFDAHTELLARLEHCHGCLSSSLHRMFGVAICQALLKCAQLLIKKNVSSICEEAAFQLYFDLSLILRATTPMTGPSNTSAAVADVRRCIQQQLHELQETSIDVVNFSVAKDSIHAAVDAAASQNSLCFGLAVSPHYVSDGKDSSAVGSTTTFACTMSLEKETDRLPLLPITTPSQVRNITTSLGMPSSSSAAALNGGKSNATGNGSSAATSISASSLWSATSKLRNLWGQ
ncbi:Hypothetical protein, putative [Bodo saltans]|uniref:Uncharacterized protein n=1 Tax=Bodo saltans TaxID=75058 RepID=A0A0S4J5F9_BODSA|nr:Hypothetical protein, putative [Bodo saltans]|eukprot:CUG86706.1 Hypothetical protein, putative [Bodo saltans]